MPSIEWLQIEKSRFPLFQRTERRAREKIIDREIETVPNGKETASLAFSVGNIKLRTLVDSVEVTLDDLYPSTRVLAKPQLEQRDENKLVLSQIGQSVSLINPRNRRGYRITLIA